MPALIRELAIAGSRKSDGTANASGKVFLYSPGTTTVVPGYQDDTLNEAWTTEAGGIPLDAGGRVKIWINDPVDVVVEDADGAIIDTMLGYNKTRAEQVEVENDGFTGAVTDSSGAVSQGLGGKTDLDTILTSAVESLGSDFLYQESTGATSRSYIEVIRRIHVTPQDFGAAGNGIRDDYQSIVNATTELSRLGGGTLYFPAGIYNMGTAWQVGTALSNVSGIEFKGAGSGVTTLRQTTTGSVLQAYATGLRMRGFSLTTTAASTGSALDIQNGVGVVLEDIVTDGTYRRALNVAGSADVHVHDCTLVGASADANARGLRITVSTHVRVTGCDLQGGTTGLAVVIGPSTSSVLIAGNKFSNSTYGIACIDDGAFANVPTGVNVIGNPSLGALTTPFAPPPATFDGGNAASADGSSRQIGNGVDGYTVNVTSGGTVTPDMSRGPEIRIVGTTTGAAYTIAAPIYHPIVRDTYLRLILVNAAGGAVTGWNFNAVFRLDAAAPALTTDLRTIALTFCYDVSTSKWRETARCMTVTA